MNETEIVIYAKVGNEQGLDKAFKVIHQEQAQVRAPNGRIRVRMERDAKLQNDWVYTLTTKHKGKAISGIASNKELNKLIDDETYSMFKSVADVFQRKTRYVFKVENVKIESANMSGQVTAEELNFEVDRFYVENEDGSIAYSEWVKIDIELDNLIKALKESGFNPDALKMELKVVLSQLPFQPTNAFMEDPSNPKTTELISAIYDNQFNRAVKHVSAEKHALPVRGFKRNISNAFIKAFNS